ncbi:MAG: HlyD family secretion protein [Gemmatimonadaceae bacterium]|nr:HlyD family secretion protein [Gloeobacterales cyanobacterium ES-bin-141]
MTQLRTDSSLQTPTGKDTSSRPTGRNPLLFLVGGLLIAGVGVAVWYSFFAVPKSDGLRLSGRIEGYETDLGAKAAGRVDAITVREGDSVRRGQLLVRLDDDELKAQLRGAEARLITAQQRQRQAQLEVDVYQSQVGEAQLNVRQATGEAQGRIDQSEATVAGAEASQAQAQAQLAQSRSELALAALGRDRYAQLLKEGATSQQQFDEAQTSFETAQATLKAREAAVEAARRQVRANQGGLLQSRTSALSTDIRTAQLTSARKQLLRSRSELAGSQSEVNSARAAKQEVEAQLAYLTITAPIDGIVTARSVEPGAVVTTGKTLLTLIDLRSVYLRGYIPEGEIGQVRVGQRARVYLDSAPTQPLEAKVIAVDPQASFTPENIYFQQERVKQVFGVKLALTNPGGYAKPGMPADGEVLVGDPERE